MSIRLRWLLALGFVLTACKREPTDRATTHADAAPVVDALDSSTRDILLALRQADDARLAELATPELTGSLDEAAQATLRDTLDWLGAVEELEQLEDVALVGGVERRYRVRFEQGSVELTVSTQGERIHGLTFDEAAWHEIVREAIQAAAGDLRVAEFGFTTPDGKPLTAPNNPKSIHYSIALEGLHATLREHEVSVHQVVRDAKGVTVYKEHDDGQMHFPEAESGSTGARLTGTVAVARKGAYQLELTITDRIAGDTITHTVEFVIE